ncbi:MAG: hypothetical protein HZA34_03860 [Candidatus Pacebacteria bacterium]|nr:hypothetical protein [Candidatus Paceibacterota bacterium]
MPRLLQHSIHFHYPLFPEKLRWLFYAHLLRGAALQMVGLFIPVFLFLQGERYTFFSFGHEWSGITRGVLAVCFYFIVYRVIVLLFAVPSASLIRRMGLTKSMMVGNFILASLFASFYGTLYYPWLLFLTPILAGIETVFYWVPYYTQFSVHADIKKLGQEVGAADFLDRLIRACLPMVGGAMIGVFGFQALHITGVLFLVLASVCLLAVHETRLSFRVSLLEFFAWVKNRLFRDIIIGFCGKYIDDASFELWAVYTYIFLGTAQRVGYLYSVVLFLSLIISYVMGWYLGKHKGRKIFVLSGTLMSMMWMFRTMVQTVWHIIAVDLVDRLALSAFVPIFDTRFFFASRGKLVFHFYIFREMILSCIGILFWVSVGILFVLPAQWSGVFVLASIGSLLSIRMRRNE